MTTIHDEELKDWPDRFKAKTIHLVCVAAGGLTTCDCAASTIGGMKQEAEVWPLIERVNRAGETGTFWPKLPLTVLPQTKWEGRPAPAELEAFLTQCFFDVAEANRDHVKLTTMYVDLNAWGGDYNYSLARQVAGKVLVSEESIKELYFAPMAT